MADSAEQIPLGTPSLPKPGASPSATALQESLQRLVSVKPDHATFAAEAARLIVKAAGAEAAALLASDARASRVRFLAGLGAPEEAFRSLVEQRGLWISLRCLNERQINVITAAHNNPFVPQHLVSAINPKGLSIAAVPVYHLDLPVGVAILFSSNQDTFTDAVLYTVSKALRACASALADAWGPQRAHRRNVRSPAPSAPEPPAAKTDRPIEIHQLLDRERQKVVRLESELKGLRSAGDRICALQAEVERLNRQAEQARAAAEAARTHASQLELSRVEAEKQARAASAVLEALLEARLERQESIEEALETAREHAGAIAEFDSRIRDLLERIGQAERFRSALESSEASRVELQVSLQNLREQLEAADRERTATRELLEQRTAALETARGQVSDLTDRLARAEENLRAREHELSERLAALQGEHAALTETMSRREQEHETDAAAWRRQLFEVTLERDQLSKRASELERELAGATAARSEETQDQAGYASASGDEAPERARLQARVAELERALEAACNALARAQAGTVVSPPDPLLDRELLEIFRNEAQEHLESCEQLLLMLERQRTDRELQDALLRRFHTLKGAAGAVGLDGVVSQLHQGETVLELIESGKHRADPATIDFLLRLLESVGSLIHKALGFPHGAGRIIYDVNVELARLGIAPSAPPEPRPPARGEARPAPILPSESSIGMLNVSSERLDDLLENLTRLEVARRRAHQHVRTLAALGPRLETGGTLAAPSAPSDELSNSGTGELSIRLHDVIESLDERHRELSAIGEVLQQQIECLRMVSLDSIFRRLPRAVRDAARQTAKQVELVAEGGAVELERSTAEALFAPLLHLVRNAIAHGIEPPAVRQSAGKPPHGVLRIGAVVRVGSADPSGDHRNGNGSGRVDQQWIELTVTDDGAGLDLESIAAKARERGLIERDAPLSKQDMIALVFAPGFSTSREVTDLSGRGVGMDAVAHRVRALGGTIEIDSERFQGTVVRLSIPIRLGGRRHDIRRAAYPESGS